MFILIGTGLDDVELKKAISEVFRVRGTHEVPDGLEPPPRSWESRFAARVRECGLDLSLDEAYGRVKNFLRDIL
jgi:hypothetical protein